MAKLHPVLEKNCKNPNRKADVVFIHGLGGDAFGTWRHGEDEKTSWPHWLAEAFPDVGVWSLGHAADPSKPLGLFSKLLGKGGRDAGQAMSLPDRAGQVLDLMRLDKHFRGERPIVFVCHSLGGLLAKQILRKAHDKASITDAESISRRTAGVLFLATPHNGADLATLADKFAAICGPTASLEALKAHDPHLRDLYNWYRNHAKTYNIETATYYEGRDTTALRLRIVDETSSQPGVGPDAVMLDEDHLSIAKPREPDAQVCLALEDMLRTVQDHAIARQLVHESQHKQRQPELAQHAASIRQQLDEQGRQIELLTAAVANLREQAQGPDADVTQKRAYELLQRGETMPAIALLGKEADAAASAAASQRDAAVSLYRQQAALQKLSDLRQAMQILEKALQLAPDDVWVLQDTGDLAMTLGQTGHAATLYQRLHTAVEHKLEADPGSLALQRDLSISHERLGAVQQAQGDLPFAQRHYATAQAIRERLAAQDPANAEWQRDLWVSHNKLGDVQQAQGDLPGAQRHYVAGLAIAERLAAQDPANAEWQRDLSISHNKLGTVQLTQGDLPGAQRHYAADLAIAERLAAQDPANTEWQRDLAVSQTKLAGVCEAEDDLPGALAHLQIARSILQALQQRAPDHPQYQNDLGWVERRIAALEGGAAP